MKKIFTFLFCAYLVSCTNHTKLLNAGNAVAKLFGAVEYSVSEEYSKGDNGKMKSLVLGLTDPKYGSHAEISDITSTAAVCMFRQLGDDCLQYENITVEVKKDSIYTQSYEVQKLAFISSYINRVDKFFDLIKSDDSTLIARFLRNKYFNDSLCADAYRYIKKSGKEHGRIRDITYTGFAYGEIEESKTPVVILKAELSCTHRYLHYLFNIVESTGEISYLEINE